MSTGVCLCVLLGVGFGVRGMVLVSVSTGSVRVGVVFLGVCPCWLGVVASVGSCVLGVVATTVSASWLCVSGGAQGYRGGVDLCVLDRGKSLQELAIGNFQR